MKEEKNQNKQFEDLANMFLSALLYPLLLSGYVHENDTDEEDSQKDEQPKDTLPKEELPKEEEKETDKKETAEVVQQAHETETDSTDVEEPSDEYEGDPVLCEFLNTNPDEFIENVVKNNTHEDYYQLSEAIRDALVDLENGTNECGWVYNPDTLEVELKLDDFVSVDDPTATLMNYTLECLPFEVSIKKTKRLLEKTEKEVFSYYLVVKL
jgi:hypothetical protein